MTSQEQILLMRMLKKQFVEVFKVDLDKDTYKFFCVGSNQIDYTVDGKSFWGNVHPDDRDRVLEYVGQVRTELMVSEDCEKSIQYRWPVDGKYRWEEIRLVRIFDDDAGHHVAMGTIKDVHEEVCARLENRRLLNEAIKEARDANLAKSEFLSGMSHEMRTPLNSIMCMTQLAMANSGDTAYTEDMLGRIYSSERLLKSIIDDVLDMHRIESGKVGLDLSEFSVGSLLMEVNDIISPMAKDKEQDFALVLGAMANRTVLADHDKLAKIFINLCSNAVKYTPDGGSVRLSFDVTDIRDGVWQCVFKVSDTGIGMDEALLENIFSPYVRDESARIGGIDGTGLGLHIVKMMVDMMGGTVDIKSKIGAGTEVTVLLGLKACGAKCGGDMKAPGLQKNVPRECGNATGNAPGTLRNMSEMELLKNTSFPGRRILLVDDRQENIFVEKSLLNLLGLEVDVACDGAEAVSKFESSSEGYYDCIMMDVRMPRMNGYDATRSIRALGRSDATSVPVFAMTADAFSDDVRASLECGMNGHLAKPVELKKLVLALKEALVDG